MKRKGEWRNWYKETQKFLEWLIQEHSVVLAVISFRTLNNYKNWWCTTDITASFAIDFSGLDDVLD